MDRRHFLRSTGIITAAGAAIPMLSSFNDPADAIANALSSSKFSLNDVKESYSTDLLIVGGGPAGVCAAISAARRGIKTMIVEQGGCLGGMATRGLVSPFMTCYDTTGEIMLIKGLFEEIVNEMVAIGGAIHPKDVHSGTPFTAWITTGHDHVTPFESEAMKLVLDRMCAKAGVKVLFHSTFVKPIVKKNKIAGCVFLTRSGFEAVNAKMYIDATGDGDVAYRAGVPCEFGNKAAGTVQPATLFFKINNVDSPKLIADVEAHLSEFKKVNGVSYRALFWRVAQAEAAGEWDIARKSVNLYRCVKEDEWAINSTRISNIDSTNSESLTSGEIEGRRQVNELMNFFHKYVPGCENATLMSTAETLGIRESRHIIGEYILSADDLLNGKVPEDSIFLASNSVDIHGRFGGNTTEYLTVKNGRWYGVPYRSLLPKEIDNLIAAGRCLSASSDAAGAVRVMPPCMAMGQAAGTAAAIALKAGISPKSIDTKDLITALKGDKVFLGQ